jgi:peptide/nickel transport system permease protein
MRHMLPNALTPALSQIGVIFASLLVSSIFVEDIFGLPGFGSLIVGGLLARDYPLLMGTVMVAVVLITFVNLITDLLYGVLDPRVRLGKETA